ETLGSFYPTERKMKESIKILHSFANKIITDRKAISEGELEEKGDILSLFLMADSKLSDALLRDIVMSFMAAGRDTTSTMLYFAMYLLATHKDVQTKLYEEVTSVLKDDERTSLGKLKEMKFLDGVIMETLRLFPSIPYNFKVAARDSYFQKDILIPEGTIVGY